MAPPWSPEEEDAMLRAWREIVESPQRNGRRSMFLRFKALCGGHTERTETSLLLRRDRLLNIYELISAFLPRSKSNIHNASDSGIQKWLAMSASERKAWFVKVNTKSYPIADIDEATFLAISKIMERRDAVQQSRRIQRSAMDEYLTSGSLDASRVAPVILTNELTRVMIPQRLKISTGCTAPSVSKDDDASLMENGDNVTSDDDASHSGNLATHADDNDIITRKRHVDSDCFHRKNDSDVSYKKAKKLWKKESEERQQILKELKQDREERRQLLDFLKADQEERRKLLDEIKQREKSLQSERNEWRSECIKMKQEWEHLRTDVRAQQTNGNL
ncbi:hypothetical protein FI667_g17323, partial [Globisporangium splendens]